MCVYLLDTPCGRSISSAHEQRRSFTEGEESERKKHSGFAARAVLPHSLPLPLVRRFIPAISLMMMTLPLFRVIAEKHRKVILTVKTTKFTFLLFFLFAAAA